MSCERLDESDSGDIQCGYTRGGRICRKDNQVDNTRQIDRNHTGRNRKERNWIDRNRIDTLIFSFLVTILHYIMLGIRLWYLQHRLFWAFIHFR